MKLLSKLFEFFKHLFSKPTNPSSNCNCSSPSAPIEKKETRSVTTIDKMNTVIKENNYTFEIGYTDATEYDLDTLCGFKEPNLKDIILKSEMPIVKALPTKWDWREHNGDTPVKNQGNCGSCWAFATVGPLEANIRIKNNVVVDLSEQFLVSCNTQGWGCNGGLWAHDYHINPGAVLESDFPYQASHVPCKTTNHPYKIKSWSYVSSQSMPTVDAIKSAIYTYGPITAAIAADSYFGSYKSGVFNHNSTGNINHGIILVGWDDSLEAWILKNSWGTNWGINGYMYIKYGVSKVGSWAAYVVYDGSVVPPTPTDTNIALNKPVTASGYYSDSYLPKNIVDGDTASSRWAVQPQSNTWITIDLGTVKTINSMKMYWSQTNYPKSYVIYAIENNTWVAKRTVTSDGNLDTQTFSTPIQTRYISLNLSSPNSSYYVLYEWEVFGK